MVRTAASATDLLVANDILSLNVLLSNLVKNPLVAHAAIYSVDNRVLAESGTRPQKGLLGDDSGLYSTPISFQEVIAGHLRVSLDMQQFQQPMTISLQSMGLLSLILLALTLMLSLRLGRQLATPLMQMRLWLRDPDDPAPGAGRQDEIGDLARQLQARLVPEKPEPELDLSDALDDDYFEQDDDRAIPQRTQSRPERFDIDLTMTSRSARHDCRPTSTTTNWKSPTTNRHSIARRQPAARRSLAFRVRPVVPCWPSSSAPRTSCAACRGLA